MRTVYKGARVYFHIEDSRPRCAVCGSEDVLRDGAYERTFRLPPNGLHPVFTVLPVPRLRCPACGGKRQAEVRQDFGIPDDGAGLDQRGGGVRRQGEGLEGASALLEEPEIIGSAD